MPHLRMTFENSYASFLRMIALILVCAAIPLSAWAECLRDNGDGTQTDPSTGLIWQSCAVGQSWNGKSCNGEVRKMGWYEALMAADVNRFQGKEDWILPTRAQLESALKVHCQQWSMRFWSSSPYAGDTEYAWFVNFGSGSVFNGIRDGNNAIRLVRGSQLSDIGIFKSSLAPYIVWQTAFDQAKRTNTTSAYAQFIKDFPNAPQAKEVQDVVWQTAFDQAKRTNTTSAYTQFIKDFPNATQAKEAQDIVWQTAFDQAKRTNTTSAYAQFIKDYPNAPQAKEVQDIIWQTAFEQAKRTNTVAAYAQFIKDFPNAPQAKEAQDIVWQTVFDQAKRTNTVAAYMQFIKDYSNASQVGEAKDHVSKLLEPPIRSAESAYKCEDAKRMNEQFAPANMPSIFDFDRCVAERKFHKVLTGTNPQSMFLAGVKYENDGERGKAKKVYLTIMDSFSEHAMALKAGDRLAGMNDVAAVEDAQWRTRQAIENSNEEVRRASQDAANRQDRSRRDFCSGKYSCENSCNSLRGNSYNHCNSACKATYSGC